MQVNITAADLKHALKRLAPIKTETYQIGGAGVSAQDSDVLVSVVCPFSGLNGTFNTNGKKLTQVVNRMSGQIDVTQEDKRLILKSAKARVELEVQSVKPIPLPEDGNHVWTLDAGPFRKALATASASASPAKSAAFGGVVLVQNLPLGIEETTSSGYRITGTDAVVLTTVTVKEPVGLQFRALLNLTASAIVQLMDGDTIQFGDTNKCLVLRSGNTTVYASKPVQKYPDFDSLLAKEPSVKVSFKTAEFLSAIHTVEPLIDETVDKGAISIHFSDGVIKCSNIGVGSTASDEAAYEQVDPDPVFDPREFDLKLIAKYLTGFLGKSTGEATLGVTDGPVRLESDNVVVLTSPIGGKK
jgi:hypothetical protein